mmetsp:Transcript_3369/g.7992  ORF Transcript_3369/g.7992 Transcript_3369/m.7992 type:complete len:200 (-) Transcript_3369:351-950(-)
MRERRSFLVSAMCAAGVLPRLYCTSRASRALSPISHVRMSQSERSLSNLTPPKSWSRSLCDPTCRVHSSGTAMPARHSPCESSRSSCPGVHSTWLNTNLKSSASSSPASTFCTAAATPPTQTPVWPIGTAPSSDGCEWIINTLSSPESPPRNSGFSASGVPFKLGAISPILKAVAISSNSPRDPCGPWSITSATPRRKK